MQPSSPARSASVRDARGSGSLTRIHPPLLLSLAASLTLVSWLGELLHRLQARRRRLMAMRRESNARMADFAVAMFFPVLAAQRAEQR